VGPDWTTFVYTFLEISGVSVVFIIFISEKISRILTIFTICLLAINLLSFTITACSDPGIVFNPLAPSPLSSNDLENGTPILNQGMTLECAQCHVRRPSTARHCYKCGVCVDKVIFVSLCFPHSLQSLITTAHLLGSVLERKI
jgi:hypothetical protein